MTAIVADELHGISITATLSLGIDDGVVLKINRSTTRMGYRFRINNDENEKSKVGITD